MNDPFQPADGTTPRWKHCYDLVVSSRPGVQIPITEVMDICDCTRSIAWSAMREAKRRLELDRQLSVRTDPPYGWTVIDRGAELLGEAEKRTRKTYRAMERAARGVNAVDRGRLSQFERHQADDLARSIAVASALRKRKSRSLTELAKEAEQRRRKQLPPADEVG